LDVRGRKEQEAGGNGKMRNFMILHNIYRIKARRVKYKRNGGRREL